MFNVDGAARGKQVLAGIGGVLHNDKGEILFWFSKGVGIKDSNETKVSAILEALRIFSCSIQGRLIVKSDFIGESRGTQAMKTLVLF